MTNETSDATEDDDDDEDDDEHKEYLIKYLQNMTQLSNILGMDCNQGTGLYWFNSIDADTLTNVSLYRLDYDPEVNDSSVLPIEFISSNFTNPRSLLCDND